MISKRMVLWFPQYVLHPSHIMAQDMTSAQPKRHHKSHCPFHRCFGGEGRARDFDQESCRNLCPWSWKSPLVRPGLLLKLWWAFPAGDPQPPPKINKWPKSDSKVTFWDWPESDSKESQNDPKVTQKWLFESLMESLSGQSQKVTFGSL